MMLLFFSSFVLSYDLSFLSNSVKKRIDFNKKIYHCAQGDGIIPLNKVDDGNCDCCDCSDEFFNTSVITVNRCINKKISNSQKFNLQSSFKKNILIRNQLKRENLIKISLAEEEYAGLQQEYNQTFEKLKEVIGAIGNIKSSMKEWVYQMNGLKVPTAEEMKARKDAFINRESTVHSIKQNIDEEEEEGFSFKTEDINFEEKKKIREEKWKIMIKNEFDELLEKAISQTANNDKRDFLSSLRSSETPQKVTEYKNQKLVKQNLRSQLRVIETKIENVQNTLKFNGKELDPVWLSADNKYIHGPVEKSKGDLRITLFRSAFIVDPPFKRFSMGNFAFLNETMRFLGGNEMNDSMTGSLNVFTFCHDSTEFLYATRQSSSRYTAWVGLPEACPEQYTEEEFQKYLGIIEPFYNKLVFETSEL